MSVASFMVRTIFGRSDKKRDAGLTAPEEIRRWNDISYGPNSKWNVLDVYRPKVAEGRLPVIVSVHGGGWVYGDKERYQYYCMSLAENGFAVVNFTYRLAPRYRYPAPLEDTNCVFSWVLEHSEEYGFDVENVFGVGDSAGAHMLGLYTCLCTDPDYAARYRFSPPSGFVPKAVALNCGVYRVEKNKKKDLMSMLMADFLPNKGTEEEFREISTIEHVTAAFPPAFVMTAEGDFLVEQAKPMAERLEELGVPVEYRYYGDKDHVLGHVFHLNMHSDEAHRCNAEECLFFKSYMERKETQK